MIVRIWRGQATKESATAYQDFVTTKVIPVLNEIDGHRGATLLKRSLDGQVEFLAVTYWESMEAIRRFAGEDPVMAVVEPAARALLSDFDTFVRHYEVAYEAHSAPSGTSTL